MGIKIEKFKREISLTMSEQVQYFTKTNIELALSAFEKYYLLLVNIHKKTRGRKKKNERC